MRKITILAFATAALAVVTVITDLIRGDTGFIDSKVSAKPAIQQVQTTVGADVST
jgi:hypothetical protein